MVCIVPNDSKTFPHRAVTTDCKDISIICNLGLEREVTFSNAHAQQMAEPGCSREDLEGIGIAHLTHTWEFLDETRHMPIL